jgi:hypothetical protein
VYPRKDAPLFPPGLEPILGNRPVKRSIIRRYGLPESLRFRNLDDVVWSQFPPGSIGPLASDVVAATRASFPEIAASDQLVPIDPSGDGLSLRARNALFRAGLLGTPWLKHVRLGELAQETGVGAKTLLEWLVAGAALERPTDHDAAVDGDAQPAGRGTPSRAVRRAADAIRRRRWSDDLTATDPRLGLRLEALRSGAATAREAAEGLQEDTFEPGAARRKVRQLREFLADAERLRRLPLQEELNQIIDAALDASTSGRTAVKLRLGFDGEPPMTLSEAGSSVGLTRERVRQLEKRFADTIDGSKAWTPVLAKALKVVTNAAPASADEAEQLLSDKALVRGSFAIESLLSASRIFGREAGFAYDPKAGVIFRDGSGLSPQLVSSAARRLTTHWGASTVDALAAELADLGDGDIDAALLQVLLETVPNLQWLDDEKQWFWVKGTNRNRLLNQVEKIMSVAGSIEIGELREGVGRFHRMGGFRPPREVLTRLCEQSGLYARDGDLIKEGPELRPWGEVLGQTVEGRIAEALFEHGPVMRRDDLERVVVAERGVNRSSFYVYLGYSPIIARYAPGVYGLRGARVTAGEVNALIPPRVRQQRLVDHGWTADGRVWIAYKMSAIAIQAGVLSVPAALEDFLSGSYLLSSDDDRPIGTLVVKGNHMWGVGPFYRRWGVEEGDHVVVTVDINQRRATVVAGGEEVLLRFQEGE